MITTTDAFINLIPYLFQNYEIDYILLGKFQTDALESRFGSYRQMSGANYYISFVQLIESERKLRFKNSIIISTKNDNISLKSLEPYEESNQEVYINIDIYHCLLVGEFSLEFVPSDLLPIVTYIGGYVAKKKIKETQM